MAGMGHLGSWRIHLERYSGEYGNATRSLILNGLFVFGMIQTADDESWGAFSCLTLFELAWHTGSIYGGVDAAHRYNRHRLDETIEVIRGNASMRPDFSALPIVSLQYTF